MDNAKQIQFKICVDMFKGVWVWNDPDGIMIMSAHNISIKPIIHDYLITKVWKGSGRVHHCVLGRLKHIVYGEPLSL